MTVAHSFEFFIMKVPLSMTVAWPSYVGTPVAKAVALPSMKIVPFTVRTFVPAFQESSPSAAVPGTDLHVYEAPSGVRFTAVDGVALWSIALLPKLSNVGGVPIFVAGSQGDSGPRSAYWYQKPIVLEFAVPTGKIGPVAPVYGAQHVSSGVAMSAGGMMLSWIVAKTRSGSQTQLCSTGTACDAH